jgi:Mce-associated membrane protein
VKEEPVSRQTLKLIKGGEPVPAPAARRRTTARGTVTRRRPASSDAVTAVLEHLDEEPTDAPASAPAEAPVREKPKERRRTGRTTPRRRPVNRAGRPGARSVKGPAAALLALLCLALAAALAAGGQWYGDRRLAEAHERALAAAKQTTVDFVSVSAASVDRDLQRILAGSTGDFKEEFSRGQAQVRAAVVENNVESRGTVLRAALVSGDLRRAVVLVAMDAVVRNTNAPQGRPSHYRIQVEVDRDRGTGRWLVSRLQFVG